MQENISENNSKADPNTAAFYLNQIYKTLDFDPWESVWDKLSNTEKYGVCDLSGLPVDEQSNYVRWADFTLAETHKIQKTIVSFCGIAQKVRSAVAVSQAPSIKAVAA
jgi:hypothetical protein